MIDDDDDDDDDLVPYALPRARRAASFTWNVLACRRACDCVTHFFTQGVARSRVPAAAAVDPRNP